MQEGKRDWYSDKATTVLCATNYVQKMEITENEKKMLISLVTQDINRAIVNAIERHIKESKNGTR